MSEYVSEIEDILEMPRMDTESLFTDEEVENLILGFYVTSKKEERDDEEVQSMMEYMARYRIIAACIDMAARGIIGVDMQDGQPIFVQLPGIDYRKVVNGKD